MNTRANSAADKNSEAQSIPAAIAQVVQSDNDGTPYTVEVDGVLFRREHPQNDAREVLEKHQRTDRIRAHGVPHKLLSQYEQDIAGAFIEEQNDLLCRIGHILVYHGHHDLWQLVYLEYNRGNSYRLGDETLFLMLQPTSGQAGYNGPPTTRHNTAEEQAAQLARQAQR